MVTTSPSLARRSLSPPRMPLRPPPPADERNVLGAPLQRCSLDDGTDATGYTRDGVCSLHDGDRGSHHICVRDVAARDAQGRNFCDVTGQDDWCSRGRKGNWCVCEWAFDAMVRDVGCDALRVRCEATNRLALEHYERSGTAHAAAAAACLRRQCG